MRVANDYYGVLGVRRDADPDEIKKAYRRLARELHPDVNPDPETQERFKEITQAYEVLSDPGKRQMYDLGADPFAQAGAGPGAGFGAGFPFSDIMDAFFGAGAGTRGPRSRARRGRNATIRVELDLAEERTGHLELLRRGHGAWHSPGDLRCMRRARRSEPGDPFVPRPGDDVPAVPGLRRVRHRHPQAVLGV
jgi:DnaJ-class molecular chaperone